MTWPLNRDWIKRHAELLAACVSFGLTSWPILRVIEFGHRGRVLGDLLGDPEYISMATVFASLSLLLLIAWSRRFWPRVRFKALYGKIAQCRDEAGVIQDAIGSDWEEFIRLEEWRYVDRFLDRMHELRAALRPLDIGLSDCDLDEEGSARLYEELRSLSATAQVGDIRCARDMFDGEES